MATTRKRLNPRDFEFKNKTGEKLFKRPGEINGITFTLDGLTDCDIVLADHCGQVTMDDSTRTRVVVGPVDGPFFLRNCHNCHVSVACRQFRCVDCSDVTVRLYCHTKSPVV